MESTYATTEQTLAADLAMDAVTLRVGDIELMSDYYTNSLALTPIEERARGQQVQRVLGRGDTPLIRLMHTPGLPPLNPREAGLFHTAFLFDTQADLAAAVYQTARNPRHQFAGSSDHLVSEAFYFTDPEGNGIELYRDRPREQWTYADGDLRMATLRLDPNAYLQEYLDESVLATLAQKPGRVGHVHLQVGDVSLARDFYVDTLGFEITAANYPGALFASAGGYHHHVAMNIWNSRGAGPRAAQLGLGDVAVTLPTREDLDALVARLRAAGREFSDIGDAVITADPWETQITFALPGRSGDRLLDSSN